MRALEEAVKERRRPATTSASSGEVRPWRRRRETANGPHLELGWRSYKVDEVEEATAELQASWPMGFCGGAQARRRRSSLGNDGGAAAPGLLLLRAGEAKEGEEE